MTQGDPRQYPNLTVSVFLQRAFLQGTGNGVDDDGLFGWIEERLRFQYPGASVSVRAADLLDGDWEIQIGELGSDRLPNEVRGGIQKELNLLLRRSIEQFPRPE